MEQSWPTGAWNSPWTTLQSPVSCRFMNISSHIHNASSMFSSLSFTSAGFLRLIAFRQYVCGMLIAALRAVTLDGSAKGFDVIDATSSGCPIACLLCDYCIHALIVQSTFTHKLG